MGIKGLTQLIGDCAPNAIKENEIKNYFGNFYIHLLKIVSLLHVRMFY